MYVNWRGEEQANNLWSNIFIKIASKWLSIFTVLIIAVLAFGFLLKKDANLLVTMCSLSLSFDSKFKGHLREGITGNVKFLILPATNIFIEGNLRWMLYYKVQKSYCLLLNSRINKNPKPAYLNKIFFERLVVSSGFKRKR